MLQSVGIVAITAILGPARRLNVGGFPGLRSERTQKSCRVRGAGADFQVDRLQQSAALAAPVVLQSKDYLLKAEHLCEGRRRANSTDFVCVRKAAPGVRWRDQRRRRHNAGSASSAAAASASVSPQRMKGVLP